MNQGVADETIVAMKQVAEENVVTYLRVKLLETGRRPGRRVEHVSENRQLVKNYYFLDPEK